MNQRTRTIAAVYLSGLLAGITLILFPSAGPIFRDQYHLSSQQFGVLFTPQTIAAITAGILAGRIAARWGMKAVLRGGLLSLAVALLLAVISAAVPVERAFAVLLGATAAVGAGFGLTVTALNAYAFDLFPGRENAAVTAGHVLTGTGQVGAALILSLFTAGGKNPAAWWGAPLFVAVLVMTMLLAQIPLPLQLTSESTAVSAKGKLPARVWVYALLVFLYGVLEGTFGNFTPLYLEDSARLSATDAALGLSLFWAAITFGRVGFTFLSLRLNPHVLYYGTPITVGAILLLLPTLSGTLPHFTALLLAGLALSFFFPYSISLASNESPLLTASVSGLMVAAIQLGNGFSGNAVGIANESIDLTTIFQFSAIYALMMLMGILYLAKEQQA